ncbi:MAG TPA: hypothetical protein DIT04_01825 [Dysgonomonas sp.]|nr:hypothetical protein [Dysgonomonas sp.]
MRIICFSQQGGCQVGEELSTSLLVRFERCQNEQRQAFEESAAENIIHFHNIFNATILKFIS